MRPAVKERRDLLTILRSTPQTLRALTAGLSDEQSRQRQAPPDHWSIAEIAAHLVDTEQSWLVRRVKLMREQAEPYLPYYPDMDYTKPSLAESLVELVRLRAENLVLLESLRPSEWRRHGQHELWGPITITWAVRHIAAHDAEHLAQVSRRLAG